MNYRYPLPEPKIQAATITVQMEELKVTFIIKSPFDTAENLLNTIDISAFSNPLVTKEMTGTDEIHVTVDLTQLTDPNQADETIQAVYDQIASDLTNWVNQRIDLVKTTGQALHCPVTEASLFVNSATNEVTIETLLLISMPQSC